MPRIISGDSAIPAEIIEEIVRVRYEHVEEFGKHHSMLTFFSDTPYPIGSDKDDVHPGVFSAMEKMGLEVPEIGWSIWDLFR